MGALTRNLESALVFPLSVGQTHRCESHPQTQSVKTQPTDTQLSLAMSIDCRHTALHSYNLQFPAPDCFGLMKKMD